jgi:bifunctional UDP-N-acetylglucosamine pyrophosphorylase / glucosamine-1-phosphate N-acetyltransferase
VGLEAVDADVEHVLVIGADTPLVSAESLSAVAASIPPAVMGLVASHVREPRGYGRVLLDEPGRALRIVEEADTTSEERGINLVNGMIFAFDARWLRATLPSVPPSAVGEIYLTTLVDLATQSGRLVSVVEAPDEGEILGVNTRSQLADAEALLRQRVNRRLMDAGVTLIDPASTFIDDSVAVGQDVVIRPNTHLRGRTLVGDGCVLGPGTEIVDSHLGENVRIWWSVVEGAQVGDGVTIGPYGRIRPGTVLDAESAIGSFAEVKNSHVGARTQMHHFSYLGDAEVGTDVNIGAGAITCNYDGRDKHPTVIGSNVFVGSDTMLIAPVKLGDRAMTGAGSVVTRDVPADTAVVGVPARPITRKNHVSPQAEPPEGATENTG